MAGGGGTRLWPISRKKHPKHVLPLLGERTLFQRTHDRLAGFLPSANILVVTTAEQEKELRQQAPQIPEENFLIEPMPKGTASVVGLAAAVLEKRDPESIMMVLPADHFIGNQDLFHLIMRVACDVARDDYLVTLGITPTFASTGYGYIQRSTALPEEYDYPVYRVQRFTEKPGDAEARRMLASGDHVWNSGMFVWKTARILAEIGRWMPELRETLRNIQASWGTGKHQEMIDLLWIKLNPETIDYGIMERAERVAVLPAGGLDWSDVGSWDSLFDVLLPDDAGNVIVNSRFVPVDTHNSLVFASGEKLVATIGIDDLIIIDSGDALLVCRKDQAQNVRQVIEALRKNKLDGYL
jgi:mannose-1-phosphate guanylyltransferase